MISSLRGRLAAKDEDYIVVEVGGLGFKVYVPTSFLRELGRRRGLTSRASARASPTSIHLISSSRRQKTLSTRG